MCVWLYIHIYVVVFGVWLSVMLESLLYSYTFCSLIFLIVFSFIFCFHLNVKFWNFVIWICHFYLISLFLYFKMCIYIIYKVLAFSFGSVLVVLILQLIASIVLICKSLWIKASAKWLNININKYIYKYIQYIGLEQPKWSFGMNYRSN